jgi:hypothetical protein
MKQRPRIYYTETDKSLMWDRWQKGESHRYPWPMAIRRVLGLGVARPLA